MPAWADNSCTAALNSARCPLPRAGDPPGRLEYQGRRSALAKGSNPLVDGVGVPRSKASDVAEAVQEPLEQARLHTNQARERQDIERTDGPN